MKKILGGLIFILGTMCFLAGIFISVFLALYYSHLNLNIMIGDFWPFILIVFGLYAVGTWLLLMYGRLKEL